MNQEEVAVRNLDRSNNSVLMGSDRRVAAKAPSFFHLCCSDVVLIYWPALYLLEAVASFVLLLHKRGRQPGKAKKLSLKKIMPHANR